MSLKLPQYELYEEGSQLRRSSKSIPSNIVEGYGRNKYKAEFIKFLIYAHASCDETILHLRFIQDIHEVDGMDANTIGTLARNFHLPFTCNVSALNMNLLTRTKFFCNP